MKTIQTPRSPRPEVLQAGASLLAIDHGARSGWAAWNRATGRLYLHGTIEGVPRQAANLIRFGVLAFCFETDLSARSTCAARLRMVDMGIRRIVKLGVEHSRQVEGGSIAV